MRQFSLRRLVVGLLLAGLCVCLSQAADTGSTVSPVVNPALNPIPVSPASLAAGKKVFDQFCAACHDMDGKGGMQIGAVTSSNLTDDKWNHGGSDGEIFNTIKNGVPPSYSMEPWGERLKDPVIWDLVNYLRSLHP